MATTTFVSFSDLSKPREFIIFINLYLQTQISSIIAFTGNIGQSNYSASKSALSGFTKSLSIEVANRGITCNLIAPGFIQSPMTDKLSDEQKKAILERIPVSRFGTPIDVASACLYLSSDEASFVTGSTMHVNGGMGMF